MVGLEVFPEQQAQVGRQRSQGGVVQARLALPQVVHQQVADRAAGQVVAVDELVGGELTVVDGAEQPHGGRGAGGEDADGVQQLVEVGAFPASALVKQGVGDLQQFQAVADGDVAHGPALGGHDERDPGQRAAGGDFADHARLAGCLQGSEPGGVAHPGHLGGQVLRRCGGQQPGHAGADDIAADQLQQARAECHMGGGVGRRDPAGFLQPRHRSTPPPGVCPAAGVGAAGVPAFLPGLPGLGLQPLQDPDQAEPALMLAGSGVQRERRSEQPGQDRVTVLAGCLPADGGRAGGEPHPCRQGFRAESRGPAGVRAGVQRDRHRCSRPNKVARVSARYPGAGCRPRGFCPAWRR